MNSISLRDPQVIGVITAAGVCLGGIIVWAVVRKRPTEEDLERMRREQLVKSGRIIDGTILDTSEFEAPVDRGRGTILRQFLLYKYEIAGVVYECSQDVTHLKDYVDIQTCRLSFPCSVRYEPRCPSNSIVVAETWSGLREPASVLPLRPLPQSAHK